MTEPTRPLADGSAASGEVTDYERPPSLEPLPEPAPLLWLQLGSFSGELDELGARHGVVPAPRELHELARGLLEHLGTGTSPDPAELASVDAWRERARELLAKGPCLLAGDPAVGLLRFWRDLCADEVRVLVQVEEPGEVARAAVAAGGRAAVALARYERDLRAVLSGSGGLDVEIQARDGAAPQIGEADGATGTWQVPEEISALFACARRLLGRHRDFVTPVLGPPTAFGDELLRLRGDLDRAIAGLQFLGGQLESVLRIEVAPEPLLGIAHGEDDEEEATDPNEGGPYPLDASQDRAAYHLWLASRREPAILGGTGEAEVQRAVTHAPRGGQPLISILVPVYKTPLWALRRCVGSVLAQDRADWELCLVDDASGDAPLSAYLGELERLDRRIKVGALERSGGISAATNAALALSHGRYVAFLDHDDELAKDAISTIATHLESFPDADLLYSDEDKIDERGERFDPLFKPEWSPDLLLSFAYTCHLSVVRRELLDELGGLRSEYDGSQDYDLALRASERARRIVHVSAILYHWRSLPSSAASGAAAKPWAYEAGRRAIEDALARRGEPAEVTEHPSFPGRYHVRRRPMTQPLVSVIIPFRDEPALLATCAASLREAPGYEHLELVLVDNGSELPETEALLEELIEEPGVTLVRAPGPFNWAAINNAAARQAAGEVLVFMNNDIEARVPGWLDALLGHALRPEVGAVGARLVYPDGAIQHAGVVIGLGGIAGHVLRGLPPSLPGYNSMAIATRNCSVVTGACMMVRREVFEAVGGFDEKLPVAFNDVDFCLKLRELGYLVVYTPLAELVHHESRSRGHTDDLAENQHIRERWGDALVAGDPYMNVHLSHWRYWCPLSTAQEDYRWKVYLETPVPPLDSSSST